MEEKSTEYSLSKEELEDLENRFLSVLEFCKEKKVPMFCSVAVANNKEQTSYKNIAYNANSHNIRLKDDQIREYVKIATKGFMAVPKREVFAQDLDQLEW